MSAQSFAPQALVLVASVLGAAGQFVFQAASSRMASGLAGFLREPRVFLGMACYLAVMALTTAAFKRGGSVATLYPIYALTFLWAALWGHVARAEALRPSQLAGLALLVLGISLTQSGR